MLFNKNLDKDNCGYGLICNRNGIPSRKIVTKSIDALSSMAHRGGVGFDGKTGDGSGLLFDINEDFYRKIIKSELSISLPEEFAIGSFFVKKNLKDKLQGDLKKIFRSENLKIICFRDVPTDTSVLGEEAMDTLPEIFQVFLEQIDNSSDVSLRSSLFQALKTIENKYLNCEELYVSSLSNETIIYKGLMMPEGLKNFYLDIKNKNFIASTCLFHQRFSTNTAPKWHLAQPFRLLAHNGEINAIKGNRNWAKARSSLFKSKLLPDLHKYENLINIDGSDSSALDNMIQLLVEGGMDLFRAIRAVIPPAWQNIQMLDPDIRAFHEYNSMHMEAWDGPAGIALANKRYALSFLDRNGMRPSRYQIEKDGTVTVASETGVNPVHVSKIEAKGRISPGGIFAVDKETGKILTEIDIDKELASKYPYRDWLKENSNYIESKLDESEGSGLKKISPEKYTLATKIFSLFLEERTSVIKVLGASAQEGTGSMGDDTALAVLSRQNRQIYDYFRQQFSQVTNPPIDSLREQSVMSLETCYGPELNIFEPSSGHAKRLVTYSPILSYKKLDWILKNKIFKVKTFDLEYAESSSTLDAIDKLILDVSSAIDKGVTIIHLNEGIPSKNKLSLNALMATGALHQALVEQRKRTKVNIIVSTGSARDTHQIACLIAFGATSVYPWLAYQTILDLSHKTELKGDPFDNCAKYRKGINKGLLKIISKLGISLISSYRGSQLFEIVGLSNEVVDKCFTNTDSRIGGKKFRNLENENRNISLFAKSNISDVSVGGLLKFIHGGEYHSYNPDVVKTLQEAVRSGDEDEYRKYSNLVNSRPASMLRDLLEFKSKKSKIKKSKVEPQKHILKRFDSAGMSLGSLSPKAHETLAEAMNSIGGRSNSGEGGEAKERYGTNKRSKIKQIASGRFGVTPEYLVSAEVLQIKIAQGAKPGEGGQLPGGKVNELIARLRYSTPGITLISPPPHHDIYSIEDLAQLIFDLKQVNPKALVSVKLVSEPGVGTIACGVAKAYADLITISGHDGGTGASPISSIRYAGSPWELGLSETHQALRESGLRGRVRVQVDGGLKTGLDVVKAAIMGAESFGFGTGPMIAMGCKYLKICHLNNCATGVATQRSDIIDRHFVGEKQRVVNYFKFISNEVREILAELGEQKLEGIIGKTELLSVIKDIPERYGDLDLSPILASNKKSLEPYFCNSNRNKPWDKGQLNREILAKSKKSILSNKSRTLKFNITNSDRSVGASISGFIAENFGEGGLDNKISLHFNGSAGQSFGCWNIKGLNLKVEGDVNDYLGKGMNGGRIIIKPPKKLEKNLNNVVVGNTALYGATGGKLFVSGGVGERFAVRNSGATAVIEGAGDHCCEYMTGGQVVILGEVGANFGAGMTGGFSYVLDEKKSFFDKCNRELINLDRILSETMDPHRQNLKLLIREHYKNTKSLKAKEILEDFERYLPYFWLVSPVALSVNDLLKATTANAA